MTSDKLALPLKVKVFDDGIITAFLVFGDEYDDTVDFFVYEKAKVLQTVSCDFDCNVTERYGDTIFGDVDLRHFMAQTLRSVKSLAKDVALFRGET